MQTSHDESTWIALITIGAGGFGGTLDVLELFTKLIVIESKKLFKVIFPFHW